jgi:hypothetical protein
MPLVPTGDDVAPRSWLCFAEGHLRLLGRPADTGALQSSEDNARWSCGEADSSFPLANLLISLV